MADFKIAYEKYIKPNEGGYANIAADKGGETYAGIARNYHPDWYGWGYIDQIKEARPIKWNEKFPAIQEYVDAFYYAWWMGGNYNLIHNQGIANLLFDFNINSASTAIRTIQQLLAITPDGILGRVTVAAINGADQSKLYSDLRSARERLYKRLVEKDSSQGVFLKGWLSRLGKFPISLDDLSGISAAALIVGVILVFRMLKIF
jgi:lysozyme family protein